MSSPTTSRKRRALCFALPLLALLLGASEAWAKSGINVTGNGVTIVNADTTPSVTDGTDFGSALTGQNVDHDFVIQSTAKDPLILSGSPFVQVTGAHAGDFTVTVQPTSPLPQDTSSTFTVRFSPLGAGLRQATISIPNNDTPNNPYEFAIQGTGIAGAPEIAVYGNAVLIPDGATSPNLGDDTEYGSIGVGSTLDHSFTIENSGNAPLGVSPVTVSDPSNFSVQVQPASSVASGGGTTTVVVRFNPVAGGTHTATVNIPNTDADENPYDFLVRGTGTLAAPTVILPSVASVEHDSALLGGDIQSNGGENASERGVYWSTTPGFTPPGQGTKASETAGPYGEGGFSVSAPGLPAASLVYFRAFATNSAGTGFSSEAVLQMEPALQPTSIQFTSVTADSFTLGWTPQSGDGVIVVARAGGLPTVDPGDYVEHDASASFGAGLTDLGGGNFVLYRGAGSSVDVTDLSAVTTYGVAIYAYAGAGNSSPDGINYQQDGPLTGSQETLAGPPALSGTTLLAFAGPNSADLQASIDANGGTAIDEYGFVWSDTVTAPEIGTGTKWVTGTTDPGTGTFSDTVGALPAGKLVYYRGYASNSSATGYSPVGTFYTEPGTQASGIVISNVGYNSFDITWSNGGDGDAYDGSIIVVRKTDPVVDVPVDGTTYTANPLFGFGDDIGNESFVAHLASGTTTTIAGMNHESTYHVAIFAYSGSGSAINYLTTGPAIDSALTLTAPNHREAYNIACSQCHAHSGFGTFVARGADQEALCKTCHVEGGQASNKKDVALHSVGGSVTDCGSCHEVHKGDSEADPRGILWTTSWRTSVTQQNQNWIRGNISKYFDEPKKSEVALAEPLVWHNGTTDEMAAWDQPPGNPIESQTNAAGKLDRLCQACHTNASASTKYHTNEPGHPTIQPNDAAGYTHPGNVSGGSVGEDCRDCHSHASGFAPTVTESNCLASGCHDTNLGGARRPIVAGPDGNGDFGPTSNSHHVNDGTGAQIVTRWDCVTCHSEGDAVTGEPDSSYHANGAVELRNADASVTAYTDAAGVYVGDWASLAPGARDEFCMSCHDADGATVITARTDPDPDATTNPLNPFNDLVTNSHEPDGFDGSIAPHQRIRPAGQTGAGSPGVVDVELQFDPLNASHHAVLGQSYTSADISTWASPGVLGAIQGVRTDLDWTSTLNCEDCHYGTASTKLNGHGTTNSRYFLMDANGNDAIGIYDGTIKTLVCYRCHDPQTNNTNYPNHSGRDGDHMSDGNNLYGIACLNCHAGGYAEEYEDGGTQTFVVGALQFGGVHGVPETAPSVTGVTPNAFVYGSALGNVTNWTPLGSPSCGAIAVVTAINNCTNHNGRGASDGKSYTRTHDRTYPYP